MNPFNHTLSSFSVGFHNYNLLLHLFKVLDDYEKVLLVNIGFIIVVFPFLTETLQSAQPYCAKIEWGREEKCCRRRPSLGISWLFLFPPFFCSFPPFFWLDTRTTDAQRGNRLHCMAENSLPLQSYTYQVL